MGKIATLLRTMADRLEEAAPVRTAWLPPQPEVGLPAYRLLRDMPGLPAGTVFLLDAQDSTRGSISFGCLKNAWADGSCQHAATNAWCASTHVLPGLMATDGDWFERIRNDGTWTI